MSVPQVVYDRLRGLVGDRCFPSVFAQGNALPVWPAIRYTLISADPGASLCGTNDEETDDVRVQLDIVAVTYPAMRALKAAAIAALDGTDPPCSRQPGGFETFDAETRTHRAVVDFVFQQSTVELPELVSPPDLSGGTEEGDVLIVIEGEWSE